MDYLQIEPNQTILVLNSSYEPLNFTNWRRAVVLLLKNKAQVLSNRVIRLLTYVRIPLSKIRANRPTRSLVYKRDDNTCQYCGSRERLTIDHIIPKSRGGEDTWENLATACYSCNIKKGNKTPEEIGMFLLKKPKAPLSKMNLSLNKSNIKEWKEYIYV
jgi:5-methylcytosine-specific restriction endonuclease McrA